LSDKNKRTKTEREFSSPQGLVRQEIYQLWQQRVKLRDDLGKIDENLGSILKQMGTVDDRKTDAIDITEHRNNLSYFLKDFFDISESELGTREGTERFSIETERAFKQIELEVIEDRIERENIKLKEIDPDAPFFPREDADERNLELYNILITLERKLRDLIEHAFKDEKNWWKSERIKNEIRDEAEDKFKEDDKLGKLYPERKFRLTEYLDFTDYVRIIAQTKPNVKFFFPKVFPDRNSLENKLNELRPMRNIIVHRPPLDPDREEHFRVYSRDIVRCIDDFLGV